MSDGASPNSGMPVSSFATAIAGVITSRLPLHGLLPDHAFDGQHAVGLVGAFEDAVDAGVAVGVLGTGLRAVAHASVHLHRFVDHVVRHLGSRGCSCMAHSGAKAAMPARRRLAFVHAAGRGSRRWRRRCFGWRGAAAVSNAYVGMAISPSLWRIAPYLLMGRPNCSRAFAYFTLSVLMASLHRPNDNPTELDASGNVEDVDGNLEGLCRARRGGFRRAPARR